MTERRSSINERMAAYLDRSEQDEPIARIVRWLWESHPEDWPYPGERSAAAVYFLQGLVAVLRHPEWSQAMLEEEHRVVFGCEEGHAAWQCDAYTDEVDEMVRDLPVAVLNAEQEAEG